MFKDYAEDKDLGVMPRSTDDISAKEMRKIRGIVAKEIQNAARKVLLTNL